jgi:hypothetical protein
MSILLITILFAVSPFAQSASADTQPATERDAVLKAVQIFFDTMTAKDVGGAREILVPQGRFHAMDMRKAKLDPRSFSNEEYFAQLQAMKEVPRERIWNPEVRVHGRIATVWAPYDFWRDGKFSHCGIDAFDLIKTDAGWKIAGGAYTLESKCEPSPLGPLQQ